MADTHTGDIRDRVVAARRKHAGPYPEIARPRALAVRRRRKGRNE
jgi:hypothetical protein